MCPKLTSISDMGGKYTERQILFLKHLRTEEDNRWKAIRDRFNERFLESRITEALRLKFYQVLKGDSAIHKVVSSNEEIEEEREEIEEIEEISREASPKESTASNETSSKQLPNDQF